MVFLLYKFMPSTFVPARLAFWTALPVGLLWEATKRIFAELVVGTGIYRGIYGPMAGFVMLMVWVYISAAIILFGAEYAAAWQSLGEENEGKDPPIPSPT